MATTKGKEYRDYMPAADREILEASETQARAAEKMAVAAEVQAQAAKDQGKQTAITLLFIRRQTFLYYVIALTGCIIALSTIIQLLDSAELITIKNNLTLTIVFGFGGLLLIGILVALIVDLIWKIRHTEDEETG